MAVPVITRALGFWSAAGCAVLGLLYVGLQLCEWLGVLGSAGGPRSASTASGLVLILTPSLLLGSAFIATMAALHEAAPASRKALTLAALAFAIAYATLTGMVYFVQLTLVVPRMAAHDTGDIGLLLFVPYRSFLFAVDLLGYSFMSLATLFGAFGLPAARFARPARLAMIANGALLPFLALQMYVPALIWPAAAWAVTFPAAMVLLARLFRALPSGLNGERP
ncbi:hypothetical protein [Novosphingobium album (ex Liu et al. 2023)]|uniref:DUF4386 domain-containing protein n=1 Tax=Novosphingobium album (ex Liu et al. 2023) TaxID=3031130 RepID=A0ABT5WM31_9SPHN|nr:hypothetical protein [Novosphingobium album (ex Liu et al. 2023)]MDE8651112.1 hypothetical protein [Novosphingobium album (ex Liu et al. 2023)]